MLTLYRLLSLYNSLPYNDTYRAVISQMLRHIYRIPELSLESLAALCFTSPTTMNRLVRKLGCKSFTDFKRDVRDGLSDFGLGLCNMSTDGTAFFAATSNAGAALFSCIRELDNTLSADLLDQVCAAMRQSRKVSYYADIRDCEVPIYARHLQLQLVGLGKETAFLWNAPDQLADAKALDESCIVLLPCAKYIPAYRNAISLIREARKQGAKVVTIAEKSETLNTLADFRLVYEQKEACMDHFLVDWILLLLAGRFTQTKLEEKA